MHQQIMLALAAAGIVDGNAWDPATKSIYAYLSGADLVLEASAPYGTARGLRPLAGNCYFSAKPYAPNSGETVGIGVCDATVDTSSYLISVGDSNFSFGCWPQNGTAWGGNVAIGSAGSSATSDIQIAVRVTSRRCWVRRAGGGWVGGGDPALDTSPTYTLSGSGLIYPMGSISGVAGGAKITLHKDASQTTGVVPAGFTAANWA